MSRNSFTVWKSKPSAVGFAAVWLLPAVIAVAVAIGGGELSGQMAEERDRDTPAEQPAAEPSETTPDLSATEQMIVDQTNRFRKQQEFDAVQPNRQLNEAAQYFADFMARTGKYGHMADGKRPSKRASNHGYEYCIVSENIAYYFRSSGFTAEQLADKFVSGWKNSPEHRDNMLDPDVTEIGVAVARRPDSPSYLGVQMFGRPQSQQITFQVSNQSGSETKYTVQRRGSTREFLLPDRARRTHQRCRPTQIEFPPADQQFQVGDGAHYVVQAASGEKIEVAEEKMRE